MLTLSWRRAGASSALAMALVVGLPALAQAQLFPNLWIQRERTACQSEPPFYKHVRHNYYGYFPTCWRRFPEGWGCPCPSPDAPDAAANFRNQPRDPKPKLPLPDDIDRLPMDGGGGGPGAPAPGPGPGRRGIDDGGMPPLPRSERDPFTDPPPGPGNTNPAPGTVPAPGQPTVPGRPGAAPNRAPFDPIQPDLPRSDAGSSPRGSALGPDVPSLEPPQSGVTASDEPAPAVDAFAVPGGAVLALPEMPRPPAAARAEEPVVAMAPMPSSLPPDASTVELPPMSNPQPAQAPRRTGLIGGLFNNMSNWRRR